MTTEMNTKLCSVAFLIHLIPLPSKNTTQTGIQSSKLMLHFPQGLHYKSQSAGRSQANSPLYAPELEEVTLMVTDTLIKSDEVLGM